MRYVLILTETYLQAKFLADHFEIPRSRWRFVGSSYFLGGLTNPVVICGRDWRKRDDAKEISDCLVINDAIVLKGDV